METSVNENGGTGSRKWLIMGIGVLVLIAAGFWFFSCDTGALQEGTVILTAGDETLGRFTIADLEKMPAVEKKIVITAADDCGCGCGADSDTSEHLYTGVPLLEVLNSIDPAVTEKYSKVITRGMDHYSQVMEMTEIKKPDEVYVVYLDSGKPLKTVDDEEGSLHLIICSDETGQRFTRWLVSLDLQ